ncbi:winged helix-turn-helix transcriptional regulator [Streptosporangium sp. NPDC003464]
MTGEQPAPTPPGGRWTDPTCPVARTVDLIGDRWTLLIIRDAMDGARAFTDFQERLGVARNILSVRLRRLVEHGILARRTAPSGKRQEYVLTEAGRNLFATVVTLRQWGERHLFAPHEPHSVLVDERGAIVPELQPRDAAGTALTVESTGVRKPDAAASPRT